MPRKKIKSGKTRRNSFDATNSQNRNSSTGSSSGNPLTGRERAGSDVGLLTRDSSEIAAPSLLERNRSNSQDSVASDASTSSLESIGLGGYQQGESLTSPAYFDFLRKVSIDQRQLGLNIIDILEGGGPADVQRDEIMRLFEEAGATKQLIRPYLKRHTNNTQAVAANEGNNRELSLEDIQDQLENLNDQFGEAYQEATEDLVEGLQGKQDLALEHYKDLTVLKAKMRLAIYDGTKLFSTYPLERRVDAEKAGMFRDVNEMLDKINDLDERIEQLKEVLDDQAGWQSEFKRELTNDEKWLLATLTEFEKDPLIRRNDTQELLDLLQNVHSADHLKFENVVAKPDRFITSTIDEERQKRLLLEALADMSMQGGEVGRKLALLALNQDLEIMSRPMLDSEFISPIEDQTFTNPTVLWDPYSNFFNYVEDETGQLSLNRYPGWITLLHELGHFSQSLDDPAQYEQWLDGHVFDLEMDNLRRHEAPGAGAAGYRSRADYRDHIFEVQRITDAIDTSDNGIDLEVITEIADSPLNRETKKEMWKRLYRARIVQADETLYGSLFQNDDEEATDLFSEVSANQDEVIAGATRRDILYEYFGLVREITQVDSRPPDLEKVKGAIAIGELARDIASEYGYESFGFVSMMSLLLTITTISASS